jgi:hypothetical protein
MTDKRTSCTSPDSEIISLRTFTEFFHPAKIRCMRQSCFWGVGGRIFVDEYRRKTVANAFGGKAPDFVLGFGQLLIASFCAVDDACCSSALHPV